MLNGYQTVLYDVVPHEKMRQNISHILDILVGAGAATREQADAALNACHFSNDLEDAVKGANFVQECIPERLELKKSTYATIQKVTGPDAIICSSTSKLFPTKLQEGSRLSLIHILQSYPPAAPPSAPSAVSSRP